MELTAVIPTTYSSFTPNSGCTDNSCAQAVNSSDTQVVTDTYESTAETNSELTEEEKQQVQELSQRDREVRAHEMAHIAAGGQYVRGGADFEFETGPDGKRYAVGGEVSIDTSAVPDNPEATVRKMQVVKRAALAPSQPSSQDRVVAAQASQKEIHARQEINSESSETPPQAEETKSATPPGKTLYSRDGSSLLPHNSGLSQRCNITT